MKSIVSSLWLTSAVVSGLTGASMLLASSVALAQESLMVGVGEEVPVQLPSIALSVDLKSARIVSVTRGETKATLYVKGLSTGSTTMSVTMSGGKKQTWSITVGNRVAQIIKSLNAVEGIKASERDGKVFVEGSVTSKEGVNILTELKRSNPGMIIDTSDRNLASSNTVVTTINRVLRENDLGNLQAHAYGRIIVLEGSAASEQQAELAMRIAQMIHPSIENRISKESNGSPAVSIEVVFVEVTKGNEKEIGIPRNFGDKPYEEMATGVAQAQLGSRTGKVGAGGFTLNWQVGGLNAFLKMIQQRSSSRVLSNPRLISRSGATAKFHSGKTVYLTNTIVKDDVVTKEFQPVNTGIILDITPKLDAIGQIDAQINTAVSDIGDIKDDVAPVITQSKVDTAVTIRDGQTILLSGLVRKRNTKTVDRVPVLADVPVLGELFKSRKSQDEETEMLILVTMNRVQAQDDKLKAAGQRLWDKAAGDVEFSMYD
jgi:type II secretory pathway component GspD/PulD (secretin)